uniref:Dynactin subunit 3 n=2 Tax=Macrostomum lignano TaxID=282301 RepID=A0A1I8HRZ1_9PLAT
MDYNVLKERIAEMEKKVFGANPPTLVKEAESCAETLQTVNKKYEASTAKRDKVQRILARFNEIDKYMDSRFCEETALSTEAKIRVILSEEQQIRETAAALERISELKSVLDSEHLQAADQKLLERFAELRQKQLEQTEDAHKLEQQTYELLNVYFSFMDLVSKQFIAWNKKVRAAEGK